MYCYLLSLGTFIKDINGLAKSCFAGACIGILEELVALEYYRQTYSAEEVVEIESLKELTASVSMQTSGLARCPSEEICNGVRNTNSQYLDKFLRLISNDPQSLVLISTVKAVCTKSFNDKFKQFLLGACLNLVGCSITGID